ncbi:MAG: ABC transporter permease [Candidatus Acidiferrales bacterium]
MDLHISRRLKRFFRREKWDEERSRELHAYLETETTENIARGMSPSDARDAARRKLGNITQVREEIYHMNSLGFLETLWQDLRFAFRMLRKNPGFTAVAILTLALGIGANTAIFSLINGVLLRPLPYRDPDRLTMVWGKNDDGTRDNVGYATYLEWKAQNKSFQELALYSSWQPTLQIGEPEHLNGLRVTNNYFRTLGVHPELGRDFLPEEDAPASMHVVILSHALWQRKFNSDPGIVGKSFAMGATTYVVAGVLPASYQSLMNQDPRGGTVEIWRVLGYDVSQPWACRTCHHLVAIGRFRDGVSAAQANAEMDTITAGQMKAFPKEYSASGVILTPLREQLLGNASTPLYVLFGAVTFVLLVACANLANLLLARAANREHEAAIRIALGAGRGRIVRQLLVENCLLALLGAAAGLLPALWAPSIVAVLGTGDLPRLDGVRLDWRVLGFAIGLALLNGVFSGLAPALRLSKAGVNDSLKEGSRGASSGANHRLRGLLVVAEVSLSLTLLVGAGLLLRSLAQLLTVPPGFDVSHVLTLRTSVLGQRFNDNKVLRQYFSDAVARLRSIPGVEAAAAASQFPFDGNMDRYGFHADGKMHSNPELDDSAERYCITPGFLSALKIPLLRGRDIAITDTAESPGAILVNQTTAQRTWPGEDPIGKRVKLGGLDNPWMTVVGVVGDVHHEGLDAAPSTQFYVPHSQWPFPDSDMTFVLRTFGPPGAMASAARQAIHSLDATQPLSRVMPLEDYVGLSVQGRRFSLILIGAFAAIALLLSVIGIYGVTAYTVAQRTREIGIRIALGAQRGEVLALMMRQGAVLILAGIAVGVVASIALTRFLSSMLFGVAPTDPATFAVVAILLVSTAALACWIPARRAMRVDPMVALRHE